ncbi:hypothetical protein GCM10010277_37720 [Streptomyces longisporoflavus]|nr:hypothetical protein GCM10010277_37720 [Streptomyces longisporoflavus]
MAFEIGARFGDEEFGGLDAESCRTGRAHAVVLISVVLGAAGCAAKKRGRGKVFPGPTRVSVR